MFKDRLDAAKQLAEKLKEISFTNPLVVALPRGGVPLGDIIAQSLNAPLEIVVPRKIGAPENEEYAIGALVEEGDIIWNERERARVDNVWAAEAVEKERKEAKRRRELYGGGKPRKSFTGKDIILVDDGIATGHTIRAAISTIKQDKPSSITVAVPVSPQDSIDQVTKEVDRVVCLQIPRLFMAVGNHYQVFGQTSDDEVIEIMKKYL